jgi:hypothetical protein
MVPMRVSEVAALKVGDIDSTRTLIWVERNGRKDRNAMLSKGGAAFRAFARNLPVWFRPLWPRSECPEFSIDARKLTGSISAQPGHFIGNPANGRSRPRLCENATAYFEKRKFSCLRVLHWSKSSIQLERIQVGAQLASDREN